MKPVIGITPDYNAGDKTRPGGREPTYFLRARYVRAIEDAGGLPLILPIMDDKSAIRQLADQLDGLLLTGSGPDLDPKLYGEKKQHRFKIMSEERAGFESLLAREAIDRELPTLGICGGMQLLNVAAGGSLYQDVKAQIKTKIAHQQKEAATELSHWVTVAEGTRLREIVKAPRLRVNSSHHQSVKKVAAGFVVNAKSEDGVIEGLELSGHKFLLAVQWHPEFLYTTDKVSRQLFERLLAASRT